jgi:hypothetical protein
MAVQSTRQGGRPTKGKGKVVPVLFLNEHHSKKAYWRSGGIAPIFSSKLKYGHESQLGARGQDGLAD